MSEAEMKARIELLEDLLEDVRMFLINENVEYYVDADGLPARIDKALGYDED